MATAFESGLEKLVHDCTGCLVVDETAWHNQDVGIVVLTAEMGYLRNPSQTGTNTLMFVEGDADAFATAANGNAGLDLATLYSFAKGMTEVGIVATQIAICAIVLVRITMLLQILKHILL